MNCTEFTSIQPFNMRSLTLLNLNEKRSFFRCSSMSMNKNRSDYLIASPSKSINVLRQLVQKQINLEINSLLQKYSQLFFEPAIRNICENNKNEEFLEPSIDSIFQDILDDAKKMYGSKNEVSQEDNENIGDCFQKARGRPSKKEVVKTKFKSKWKHLKKKKKNSAQIESITATMNSAIKSRYDKDISVPDDSKWDPLRLSTNTLFVLGSKANKALGFGAARGRLYTKHADLFRYIGDQEDKEWLHKNQLMAPTGGKAYLLVMDDILELINSKEYQDTPGVNISDMGKGFTVPQSMIDKMTAVMQTMRTNRHKSRNIFNDDSSCFKDDTSSTQTTPIHEMPLMDSDFVDN